MGSWRIETNQRKWSQLKTTTSTNAYVDYFFYRDSVEGEYKDQDQKKDSLGTML